MRRNFKEDDKRVNDIMSQQEVIELYMSYFNNLPMILRNTMGEVEDVYGKYCEDLVTEEELLSDPNKMCAFLISYINFLWIELQSDYDSFDRKLEGLNYIFECYDGTFGELYEKETTTMGKLKLASEYGWFVTPNEVFGIDG